MLIDVSPLKKYRDFRLLFIGQLISYLGTMVSYMAVPYQVYELTKSTAMVGALGVVQLGPVIIFGLLGGTYADRINRRKLLLISEFVMALVVFLLLANSFLPQPSVAAIFILVAVLQGVTGFHRPAMEALTQKMVEPVDYAAVGALSSFRSSAGAIAGPLLGGLLVAGTGLVGAYLFDFLSFLGALICIGVMRRIPDPEPSAASPLADAKEGIRFALSKPALMGTYLIDIAAMLFAFPVALFPAMAQQWGGASAAGLLFSAMAIGSLVATLFSGWSGRVQHHGRVVVLAAICWGLFIIAVGFSSQLWLAILFLALAGGADMISGLFRGVIWNQVVPNNLRGRLSGIEMISYMTGPLLGNTRAGWVAAETSLAISLWSGGIICVLAVMLTAWLLPSFWHYRADRSA
ncbi:MAG TPA: MFS transporter [Spongiibacteraceae bacterium]|nr:MFS transporter [Spongiibacteraceae bacterium]